MRKAPVRKAIQFFLLGSGAAAIVPMVLACCFDLSNGVEQLMSTSTGQGQWTIHRWDRASGSRLQFISEKGKSWSVSRATGSPDTNIGGDQVTAWASAFADGSREWLTLDYPNAVIPKSIHVYEICSTGALEKVSIFDGGSELIAWTGIDPQPIGNTIGRSDISIAGTFKTRRVKLYFNSPAVPGWNEVDAVGLEGTDGVVQWANSAEASSEYGGGRYSPSVTAALAASMPSWSGLQGIATASQVDAPRQGEVRISEARGWPLFSMCGGWRSDIPANPDASASSDRSLNGSNRLGSVTPVAPAPMTRRSILPIRIIPSGFVVDAILYAFVLAALAWLAAAPRKFLREAGRVRQGRCIACGYDLRYDFVPGCPECGWNRNDPLSVAGRSNGSAKIAPEAFSGNR